jgi:hypothetical protein
VTRGDRQKPQAMLWFPYPRIGSPGARPPSGTPPWCLRLGVSCRLSRHSVDSDVCAGGDHALAVHLVRSAGAARGPRRPRPAAMQGPLPHGRSALAGVRSPRSRAATQRTGLPDDQRAGSHEEGRSAMPESWKRERDQRGQCWLQAQVHQALLRASIPLAPSAEHQPPMYWGAPTETRRTLYLWLAEEQTPRQLLFAQDLISACGAGVRPRQAYARAYITRRLRQMRLLAP